MAFREMRVFPLVRAEHPASQEFQNLCIGAGWSQRYG